MMRKLLITGAGGDMGLEVSRILHKDYNIIGIDCKRLVYNPYTKIINIHPVGINYGVRYLEQLWKVYQKEKCELIVPCSNIEFMWLHKNRRSLKNINVFYTKPEVIELCQDKMKFYNWCEKRFPVPQTYKGCILKPRISAGGKGLRRILPTEDEVLQEFIKGDEYTCGVLLDKKSNVLGSIALWRKSGLGLPTQTAIVKDYPEVCKLAEDVCRELKATYTMNVQIIDGRIIEINPRISGSCGIRHDLGFTDVKTGIDIYFGKKPKKLTYRKNVTAIRRTIIDYEKSKP